MSTDPDPEETDANDGDGSPGDPPADRDGFAAQLLAEAVDPVVTADRDHRIVFANPAVETTFGYAPGTLEGRQFSSLFPDGMTARIRETLDRLLEGGTTDCRDVRLPGRHRDGRRLRLSISLFAHGGDDGDVYVTGIVRDVTDRVEREIRLEEKNEQLTRLASVLSHDLREPLNNARAKLTLARKTGDEDYIEDVVAVHDRMGELVDDVLALTTQGLPVEDTRPVSMADVVDAAITTVGDDDVTVVVEDSPTVVADPDRLQTIFENLLTNAARHAGPGVEVRIGPVADDGFFVADDGPGIPPEDREDVFEYGVTDSDDGTGLGLSIVRDVATAHDWTVAVVDSRDGGARFEFTGVDVVEDE